MDNVNTRVNLKRIIEEFKLETAFLPDGGEDVNVISMEINRPGLHLAGFYEEFDANRVQVIGNAEAFYIAELDDETMRARLAAFFSRHPVAVVYSHGNRPSDAALELAEYFNVPVFFTAANTSEFLAALIAFLNVQLAPQITRHGVFVEVYGEGVLILGDSGVGKSETAIELIKRGHRFIADDAVELRKVSAKTIVGSAPELIKYYIELRGIGIVDVRRIFGMGSVKATEKVDLIINLEPWEDGKMYDRFGLESEYTEIMGIKIPSLVVPVKPGRNLAVIIEIAAMNHRQKKMGYNTAEEFNRKLLKMNGLDPDEAE
ncbi:MAG: HPr(Ser) kinase/phosphatase [Clostridia bacterium]|nr:HPr(Ser) kinase/phosphatase [Clostridia bacterium]